MPGDPPRRPTQERNRSDTTVEIPPARTATSFQQKLPDLHNSLCASSQENVSTTRKRKPAADLSAFCPPIREFRTFRSNPQPCSVNSRGSKRRTALAGYHC